MKKAKSVLAANKSPGQGVNQKKSQVVNQARGQKTANLKKAGGSSRAASSAIGTPSVLAQPSPFQGKPARPMLDGDYGAPVNNDLSMDPNQDPNQDNSQ